MHVANFDSDLSTYRRCPDPLLNRVLRSHFGSHFSYCEWTEQHHDQTRGVDLRVFLAGGQMVNVELKQSSAQPEDIFQVELPLETLSHVRDRKPGFLLRGGMRTKYVLWIFADGQSVMIPFRALAAVFRANAESWKSWFRVTRNTTQGKYEIFQAEIVWVPLCRIRSAIRRHLLPFGIKYQLSVA